MQVKRLECATFGAYYAYQSIQVLSQCIFYLFIFTTSTTISLFYPCEFFHPYDFLRIT
jgi:hypothetical protein